MTEAAPAQFRKRLGTMQGALPWITTPILLAALESVSLVTWFDEDTPVQLLTELKPQIYVKGGDYDVATLPETRAMQGWGGRAQALPFVDGYSTTALVRKIRA